MSLDVVKETQCIRNTCTFDDPFRTPKHVHSILMSQLRASRCSLSNSYTLSNRTEHTGRGLPVMNDKCNIENGARAREYSSVLVSKLFELEMHQRPLS
jgi:hypothetical protein